MILVLIEHDRGIINPYSLQLLTYAHTLGKNDSTNVKAIVIGQNVQALTSELSKYSPDEIIIAKIEIFSGICSAIYTYIRTISILRSDYV